MEKFQELLNQYYILRYIFKSLFSALRFYSSLSQPFVFFLHEIVITRSSFKNSFLNVCWTYLVHFLLLTRRLFLRGIIGFDFQYSELLSPKTINTSQKSQHVHVQRISCVLTLMHRKGITIVSQTRNADLCFRKYRYHIAIISFSINI